MHPSFSPYFFYTRIEFKQHVFTHPLIPLYVDKEEKGE